MSVTVKTYVPQVTAFIEGAIGEGIEDATQFLHSKTQLAVGRQYPPASRPGESPARRTGFGQKNIVWTYDPATMTGKIGIRAGSQAMYMIYLELGTSRIRPRPWLFVTLIRFLKQIGDLAVGGGGQRRGASREAA